MTRGRAAALMPSILALDQGTTGSTALVVHQDGTVLGRGYREFTQHFPQPGWVEHDPEEIFRVSRRGHARGARAGGERPAGIGITNQRETVVLWDRRTLAPVAPAIVWQDRRTTDRCRELREAGVETLLRERTGLVADPYFSATKLEWLLRDAELRRRAGAGRAGRRHGRELARRAAHRRPGARHRPHQRVAHAALRPGVPRDWDPELLAALRRAARAAAGDIVPSAGVVGETGSGAPRTSCSPSPASPATSRRRCSDRDAARDGLAKNTYGTGAFLLVYTGDRLPTPAAGRARDRGVRPTRVSRPTRSRAACSSPGRRSSGCATGSASSRQRGETEALARSVPDTGGVHFVPAFVGLGTPHWEPEARGTITGLTRGTTRAHLVRAALEAMAFSSADLLEAMADARRSGGAGAAGRRWRLGQRLADAVSGRCAGRAGRAPRHGGDDRAGRRRARRARTRGVEQSRRIPGRTAVPAVRTALAGQTSAQAARRGMGASGERGAGVGAVPKERQNR